MAVTKLDLKWGLRLIVYVAGRMLREADGAVLQPSQASIGKSRAETISRSYLSGLAEAEYAQRRSRAKFFDGALFADPAWDILLDLYAREGRGLLTSVTSCCIASQVPPTTALRWIDQLKLSGLIEVVPSERDRRVSHVQLTDEARERMTTYLEDHAQAWDRSTGFRIAAAPEKREDLIAP